MLYFALNFSFILVLSYTASFIFVTESRSYLPSFSPRLNASPWEPIDFFCFTQPLPPEPRGRPVELNECEEARELIMVGDKAWAPMDFSGDKEKGYFVPKVWGCCNCHIILHAVDGDYSVAEDTFTLALVAHVAEVILKSCVKNMPARLGGTAKVGPKKVFEIIVAAIIPKPNGGWSVPFSRNTSSILRIETS